MYIKAKSDQDEEEFLNFSRETSNSHANREHHIILIENGENSELQLLPN
jgi:hypothetical protein